jgi:hypothetical protein
MARAIKRLMMKISTIARRMAASERNEMPGVTTIEGFRTVLRRFNWPGTHSRSCFRSCSIPFLDMCIHILFLYSSRFWGYGISRVAFGRIPGSYSLTTLLFTSMPYVFDLLFSFYPPTLAYRLPPLASQFGVGESRSRYAEISSFLV